MSLNINLYSLVVLHLLLFVLCPQETSFVGGTGTCGAVPGPLGPRVAQAHLELPDSSGFAPVRRRGPERLGHALRAVGGLHQVSWTRERLKTER